MNNYLNKMKDVLIKQYKAELIAASFISVISSIALLLSGSKVFKILSSSLTATSSLYLFFAFSISSCAFNSALYCFI